MLRKQISAFAVLLAAAGCSQVQERSRYDVWVSPRNPVPSASLPKLAQGPSGTDWSGAAVIPLASEAQVVFSSPAHPWKAADGAAADFRTGWNDQGLLISGSIRDKDILNAQPAGDSWKQDCVELYIDGRRVGFMSPSYGEGAYQLFVRPPVGGKPAQVIFANGREVPVTLEGRLTPDGWAFELSIPWSAFGGKPTKVALGFQLDDSDAADNGARGLVLAAPRRDDLYRNLSVLMPFELATQPKVGLNPSIIIEVPPVVTDASMKDVAVLLAGDMAARGRKVRISAAQAQTPGIALWSVSVPVEQLKQENGELRAAVPAGIARHATWPVGYGIVRVDVLDDKDQVIGYAQQSIVGVGSAVNRFTQDVAGGQIGCTAEFDPFKAAAWCGAAASVDRLNRAVAQGLPDEVAWRYTEAEARVRMMQRKSAKVSRPNLQDLLILGRDYDAEVTVEFPAPDRASIALNWGSIPLGSVVVREMSSPDAAAAYIRGIAETDLATVAREFKQPSAVTTIGNSSMPVTPAETDSHSELFLWSPASNTLWAFDCEKLPLVKYNAVLELPTRHSNPAKAVAEIQQTIKAPSVDIEQARRLKNVLVVGDPSAVEAFKDAKWLRIFPRQAATTLTLANGHRVYSATAADEATATYMLKCVLREQPITVSQVDKIRKMTLARIAPDIRPDHGKPAIGARMYCGDIHMHTFYSDGSVSPAALMLEAIYAQQDFSVMTDHNTIAGALRARELLASSGIRYDPIVGEEFTSKYHANIFPVKAAILPPMEPADLADAVHQQGGFVQWNHPGFPDWGHQYILSGMPLGFDAWEHLPQKYDLWREQGTLPLITGSTDTHDGTFGEWPERTIVFAKSAAGPSVAEALKARQAIAVIPDSGTLFVGSPDLVNQAYAALAEGTQLKRIRAQRLTQTLGGSKPEVLLKASETAALANSAK